MKQIIETEFQVYSTNNMCYVKYCYFLIYVLNIAEQYYVSKSDKDFYWRNTSIMLNTVGVFSNFCKKNKCFPYRISLDIFFFYNFLFTGTTESRLIKQDISQSISLVIGLSISILINLILISCGILLCRYFLTSRYN